MQHGTSLAKVRYSQAGVTGSSPTPQLGVFKMVTKFQYIVISHDDLTLEFIVLFLKILSTLPSLNLGKRTSKSKLESLPLC